MTYSTAAAAIREYIEDNWTSTSLEFRGERPSWKIANRTSPLDANGKPQSYVRIEIEPNGGGGSMHNSPGKQIKERYGIISAHCFTPHDRGELAAQAMAEEFGDMLHLKKIGGAQCDPISLGRPEQGDDAGMFIRCTATITFAVFYTG